MKKIYFVTQNDYKFKKFKKSINSSLFEFIQLSESTPEIQAATNAEIASFSAKWAADKFNKPVICEDVGLYINTFNGFPGPYLSQVEKWLKTDGFLKLTENVVDRSAQWEYSVAFCAPKKEPVSFSTFPKGKIAERAQGKGGWYADKVFLPDNDTRTIAELLDLGIYKRNKDHYESLVDYLEKNFEFK
ncbi:MAG: non-canonical purine NTP pyrophosphatase [Candidatus Levybacteria bacterium CG_4_10_14_0_8_um_filter_35_23]|nr:MAG: non-canonical purine NTP pyrophosphatase [Candidatus Levybacteria bacterium CG_4_10_14_0_8_um_filter_35_23]